MTSLFDLRSGRGWLTANDKPFRLTGVTYWGAESSRGVPGGLNRRSLDDLFHMLAGWGFNAVRLPFLHQHVLFDEAIPGSSFDHSLNPFLIDPAGKPVHYLEMLRVVARRAASHGLLIWLVAHSSEDIWYSRAISEATVLDSWTSVARRLCPQWNIVGVDLKNKPTGASWGKGLPTDWNVAAATLGDHANAHCARWLIGVEGVGDNPGAAVEPETEFAAMYPQFHGGENLAGAARRPMRLKDHSRLVYMPHTYGPGVRSLPYMDGEEFPHMLEQVCAYL